MPSLVESKFYCTPEEWQMEFFDRREDVLQRPEIAAHLSLTQISERTELLA